MKGKNLFVGLSDIDPKYIEEAETETIAKPSGRSILRRPLLVAAILALMLALVGCAAVYVMKMQDMKIGDLEVTTPVFDDDMEFQGYASGNQQVLTLTGLKGTPSYQATQEWFAFRQAYDPDYAIYNSVKDNKTEYPSDYDAYHPYTQEMVDKIEEIAEKYSLKLLGAVQSVHGGKLFCQEVGIDSLLTADSQAELVVTSASIYEGGSMLVNLMTIRMPEEEGQWSKELTTSLYYNKKDCFNPFTMEIDDSNNWREWNYTTAAGYDVLMLRSDGLGWIICDRKDATISVRVLTGRDVYSSDVDGNATVDSTYMTDRQFELVADAFDFSMEPQYQGAVTSFEGVDPTNHVQTQNGCTIEVKEAVTDGLVARITLGVTVPEDVPVKVEGKTLSIRSNGGSVELQSQEPGEVIVDSSLSKKEDGDGLDNTMDMVLEYVCTRTNADGEEVPAIDPGSTLVLHWEDLAAKYWDSEKLQEETLWCMEGNWQFAITFDEGDFREMEMIQEPVTTNVVVAWTTRGEDVYGEVTITSFKLRSMSAVVKLDSVSGELTDYKNEKYVMVVLKDGSEVRLQERSGGIHGLTFLLDEPIALDEVAYVRLADGTRLEMP